MHVAADRPGRIARKHGGTGDHQPRTAGRCCREGSLDRRGGDFLRRHIHAAGAGPHQQQGAVTVGGEPGAVDRADFAAAHPTADGRQERTGRVGQPVAHRQRRGGGAQLAQHARQVRMQRRHGEHGRGGSRRQQIAVREQHRLILFRQRGLAAGDHGEKSGLPQRGSNRPADPGEFRNRRPIDADQDQAGGGPLPRLLQHHARRGRTAGRQERQHVGANLDLRQRRQQQQDHGGECPQDRRRAAPATGLFSPSP